jgi:hypothetical protein
MPRLFDDLGVRFAYPDNWQLEEQAVAGGQSVTVSSPGGAFWWLDVHPADADLAQLAKAVVEGLRQEYNNIDIEAVIDEVDEQELIGYDVNFYCLDLTNTAQVRGFQTEAATYVMLWQAEDREFEEVEPVFQAITTSLIRTANEGVEEE